MIFFLTNICSILISTGFIQHDSHGRSGHNYHHSIGDHFYSFNQQSPSALSLIPYLSLEPYAFRLILNPTPLTVSMQSCPPASVTFFRMFLMCTSM
jgi:hypothetical protein